METFLVLARRLFPPLLIKRKLLVFVVLLAGYGWLVYELVTFEHLPHIEWGAESTVLNGVVLGFLISFRNNHAYDRWWEARKLWGQLVNDCRNLCLKVRSLAELGASDREQIAALVVQFARSLERHLRLPSPADERARRSGRTPRAGSRAFTRRRGNLFDPAFVAKLRPARRLVAALARRTRQEPDGYLRLMRTHQVHPDLIFVPRCLRHGLALYVLISPFYLIEDIGPSSFPLFLLAAYFLLGIEMVAEEIEEPFGATGDNLPLEHYCAKIEASVREILRDSVEVSPRDA